jgi:transcriptional regulator with XRE-family HTH domain
MPKVGNVETISGEELRRRIDRLGLTYSEAARRLGLTVDGLQKQMRGVRRIGRQTEIILGYIEKERGPQARKRA